MLPPDCVTVQRLEEKLQDGSFAPALELRGADDAVGAINTASSPTASSSTSRPAWSGKTGRAAERPGWRQTHVRLPVASATAPRRP